MVHIHAEMVVSAAGSTLRCVRCENCGSDYIFEARFRASASIAHSPWSLKQANNARDDAEDEAQRNLARMLRHLVYPVPCPSCGWYQEDMIEEIQRRIPLHYNISEQLMVWGGVFSACGGVLLGGVALIELERANPAATQDYTIMGLLAILAIEGGIVCAVWGGIRTIHRKRVRETYDANTEIPIETRISRGRKKAMLLADYQRHYPDVDTTPFIWP
jgi:hypothetical protein